MTCIVSIRAPQGILIAGDSQGTGHGVKDFGQKKIFPLFGVYAIGVYGMGHIDCEDGTMRSIYEFLQDHKGSLKGRTEMPTLTETAMAIGEQLFRARWKYVKDLTNGSEADIRRFFKGLYLGLHIDGYELGVPATAHVMIKQEPHVFIRDDPHFPFDDKNYFALKSGYGIKVNGEDSVHFPRFQTIDEVRAYAVSIIKSAAKNADTVGGEIKVGIIASSLNFKWLESDSC